jgi:hypothetical protein
MADWRSVRASTEHENQLVNYRFTWLLTFETLLFTAFGIFVKEFSEYAKDNERIPPLGLYYIALVGFVNIGIIAAFYVERYIRGAENAHDLLVQWWRDKYRDNISSSANPPICGGDLDPIISLKEFNLKPSKKLFNYLIAKFTRQSRYPLLFVFAWLGFNYTLLRYLPFAKYKPVSLLALIGWFIAVLLPLLLLFMWVIIYLSQRKEFKEHFSPGTISAIYKFANPGLACLALAFFGFAMYYAVLFGPWARSLSWLKVLLPVIVIITMVILLIWVGVNFIQGKGFKEYLPSGTAPPIVLLAWMIYLLRNIKLQNVLLDAHVGRESATETQAPAPQQKASKR